MNFRLETDSMGEVKVEEKVYWGAQTQRSLQNFKIGNEVFPSEFIKAYALVKQAAAHVNAKLGEIDSKKAKLIEQAAQEIIDGKMSDQFPLSIWQTGSGTQTNMNLNEVISNRAIEIAGGKRGSKKPVHPNDDVNKGQSTNDTFPTAMHVSAAIELQKNLIPALEILSKTFAKKAKRFNHLVKMGRTHLQDATPITVGQEMGCWSAQLQDAKFALLAVEPKLLELAAGATAVGTGLNAHAKYPVLIAKRLSEKTGLAFTSAKNKFTAIAAHDALVSLSGALCVVACAFTKITNDIRWLASGPRGGIGELILADNEPGSSIMPGKVNPTQAEAAGMVCFQVMGNHTAIMISGSQGDFQLNVRKPIIIYNILQSIRILSDALVSFDKNCATSIEVNEARLEELKHKSLMLVTALAPHIGYDEAAKVAKDAHINGKTLKEVVVGSGLMTAKEFDTRVKPEDMV